VCIWRVLIGKLPTRDNLIRRHIAIPSSLCPLCNIEEETIQYVFFKCSVAQKVWDKGDSWIGIESVRHHTAVNHFMNFSLTWCNNNMNTVWKGMWIAIVWEIWKHKDNVVFKNGVVDVTKFFMLA